MIPAILFVLAVALLAASFGVLRTLGSGYRVGRLLSAAPAAEIPNALELASGPERYVRVSGRISSDEEFPDEHDRPLVYRRKRVEVRSAKGWQTGREEREAVPFGLQSRSDFIAVDVDSIGIGLVAIPRISEGTVGDLPADLVADLPGAPATDDPARLVIEQLSAVEHATVCGTPVLHNGQPMLTAGLGRPLIVTTLEVPAAMRLLAAGHQRRVRVAAVLLLGAAGCALAGVVALLAGL